MTNSQNTLSRAKAVLTFELRHYLVIRIWELVINNPRLNIKL